MDLIKNDLITEILGSVKNTPVLTENDSKYLVENTGYLNKVYNNVHIWRTDFEKRSIICDEKHPTAHSKFHQAMREQKVQFEQSIYLAKDFEMKKLEIEELECDLEELGDSKRDGIKKRKIDLEIQFKEFELKSMKVQMKYRMLEVKGWKKINDDLFEEMKADGISDKEIWDRDAKETEWQFFRSLSMLQGIKVTKDSAERTNLVAFARHCYNEVKEKGMLNALTKKCNIEQLDSLKFIEANFKS